MASLLVIGECMMELSEGGSDTYHRSFAGDTYNSAVYAKRWWPGLHAEILTAVGVDPVSDAMVAAWAHQGIGAAHVLRSQSSRPGIYLITTDPDGERSFTYWREHSAATRMISLLADTGGADALPHFDIVYFSGISLAILSDQDKAVLLTIIERLRDRGSKVAFDPNYRSRMWPHKEQAVAWMTHAYDLADIAFPGCEDHREIFAHGREREILDYLSARGVDEIIVKSGNKGVFAHQEGELVLHLPFEAATNQVDSTAAGDCFAGTYLAERMKGGTVADAVRCAAATARFVVEHRGAIVDADVYTAFLRELQR